MITNKASYIDDETRVKLMKVVTPGIRKMKVNNVACVLPTLLSIYLTIHLCISKLSTYMPHSVYTKDVTG